MDDQQNLDFAEHARRLVEAASTTPWPLRDRRTVIPREVLAGLAEVAIKAPVTGREIDYTQTLRECLDALAAKDHGGDPDLHVFGLMLAMMSMDRGGHLPQANACENALQYMASLPAWREVNITFGGTSS